MSGAGWKYTPYLTRDVLLVDVAGAGTELIGADGRRPVDALGRRPVVVALSGQDWGSDKPRVLTAALQVEQVAVLITGMVLAAGKLGYGAALTAALAQATAAAPATWDEVDG